MQWTTTTNPEQNRQLYAQYQKNRNATDNTLVADMGTESLTGSEPSPASPEKPST
jgi:hypothetical protein